MKAGEIVKEDVYGYVVYIGAYATASNPNYENGALEVMYGGVRRTFLGCTGFEPYKTERGANNGRNTWEKTISSLQDLDDGWRYVVGGVMPLTEEMINNVEQQNIRDFGILRNMDGILPEISEDSRENRRRLFKVIK